MVLLLVLVVLFVVLAAVGIGVYFLVKSNNKPRPPALPHHRYPQQPPQYPSRQQTYPPQGWGN
ncbi:hypothetical protein [Amycolatopsis regifaucium]|uniref:Uncharacterized protein n=1 Tax=Amycolatopsis regifaucium TaxID=546365 RepID=A0A154MCW2_9PSEU|nr:hypothetical protein [Amycolatopsis regifaucium]KZB82326.1 hypothetical protein AVL48_10425 [Amycolatopsis regifaucium]OKA10279.1 hypothetical protein ATP06_0205135 [Amycolatopsis regifaucium]SFG89839.1 hypothetical protein SAMN04489731_101872 [Amycolatopsis regifaucium]